MTNDFYDFDVSLDDPEQFIHTAKYLVVDRYNAHLPAGVPRISIENVFIVWFCKVLDNWKAIVATNVTNDGTLFEVSHNGAKNETYVDTYMKIENTKYSEPQAHIYVNKDCACGHLDSTHFYGTAACQFPGCTCTKFSMS